MGIRPGVVTRHVGLTAAVGLLTLSALVPALAVSQSKPGQAPEVFRARASVDSSAGRGDVYLTIRIDQYSAKRDIEAMEQALKNGSAAFSQALRQAPIVGRVEMGKQTFALRWARQQSTPTGLVISLVTDSPVYFVGGGLPGAKPREGFEVAVLQLILESSGVNEGTMVAAARVKPGGPTGVEIDAYDAAPIKLRSVTRQIS